MHMLMVPSYAHDQFGDGRGRDGLQLLDDAGWEVPLDAGVEICGVLASDVVCSSQQLELGVTLYRR